jgi:Domain of unknown function (DUF222)
VAEGGSGWVSGHSFEYVIDGDVRALLSELAPGSDARTPAERIERITALDRAVHMTQAALAIETAAFAEQRRRGDIGAGASVESAGRGAALEVALARRVSKAAVDYQLAFAVPVLADFPQLAAAFLDGQVSQSAAKHIVKACETLDSDQRRAIDPELTALAVGLTPGKARKAADRLAASTDPDSAVKRARAARARKEVRTIVNGDGTGSLIATLPVEQTVACWQALDHDARGLRADGDERPIRDLMCDLFVERLTGQSKATDLNLEVGVVVAASSLLGNDDQPAKLTGHNGGDYGTLPAGLARELAASDQAWWRRLVCDPDDGHLLSMDTKKRRFTGALRKFLVYRDGTSRRPFSDSPIYDIDHVDPHASGGPTSAANGQGLGKTDHLVRELPGWTVEAVDGDAAEGVRWTTPTGHGYTSKPPPILGEGNTRRRVRRGGSEPQSNTVGLLLLLLRLWPRRSRRRSEEQAGSPSCAPGPGSSQVARVSASSASSTWPSRAPEQSGATTGSGSVDGAAFGVRSCDTATPASTRSAPSG